MRQENVSELHEDEEDPVVVEPVSREYIPLRKMDPKHNVEDVTVIDEEDQRSIDVLQQEESEEDAPALAIFSVMFLEINNAF